MFSWIVYDIASMDEIRWILMYDSFNLDPLTYCSLDDFPVPKFEVVKHIYETMSNDLPPAGYSFEDLEYVVSGWCILGGYEINGLNYTLDHFMGKSAWVRKGFAQVRKAQNKSNLFFNYRSNTLLYSTDGITFFAKLWPVGLSESLIAMVKSVPSDSSTAPRYQRSK
ncbi:hypothetical protein GQ42DRAFT_79750 [Ramicandelaber brevisporus]|nr:hypothetical protein GQ42DRAFT_79750 [Ramicandelaber brevisporus]